MYTIEHAPDVDSWEATFTDRHQFGRKTKVIFYPYKQYTYEQVKRIVRMEKMRLDPAEIERGVGL